MSIGVTVVTKFDSHHGGCQMVERCNGHSERSLEEDDSCQKVGKSSGKCEMY